MSCLFRVSNWGAQRLCAFISAWLLFFGAAVALAAAATTLPSTEGSISGPNGQLPTIAVAPEEIVHGFLNLDFSDHHLTSRGINLENKGLVTQQLLRLDWELYKPGPDRNQVFNEVTLTTSLWNDIDTHRSGVDRGNWNEIDPTIGPNLKFLDDWTFESPFTAFVSETGSFATCWAWDPKLTYHDHFLKNFSFNPYVEFFDELDNKITVELVPADSRRSYYGAIGADPTYVFQGLPLKLELPSYLTITGNDLYQRADGSGGGSGLGLFSTTFKATVPLELLSTRYGTWSVYGAVQYDYLDNPGLLDGNQLAGAALSRERSIVVFHGGITFRF